MLFLLCYFIDKECYFKIMEVIVVGVNGFFRNIFLVIIKFLKKSNFIYMLIRRFLKNRILNIVMMYNIFNNIVCFLSFFFK